MTLLGELASLGAAACWAVGLNLFRRDVREIGARPVNLFKGVCGSVLFVACLPLVGYVQAPAASVAAIALSGVLGVAIGDTLLFHALSRLGAHRAALLNGIGPVLTVIGGWLLLDERLNGWEIGGIALATAGVTAVVYFRSADGPRPKIHRDGVLFGLAAAACQSGGVLLTKHGLADMDAFSGSAVRLLAATASLILYGFIRRDLDLDLKRLFRAGPLARLVPATLVGTFCGLWLMQTGIKHVESGIANALLSTTPLFTLPIAVLVLKERMSPLAVVGSLVGVAGIVILFLS